MNNFETETIDTIVYSFMRFILTYLTRETKMNKNLNREKVGQTFQMIDNLVFFMVVRTRDP